MKGGIFTNRLIKLLSNLLTCLSAGWQQRRKGISFACTFRLIRTPRTDSVGMHKSCKLKNALKIFSGDSDDISYTFTANGKMPGGNMQLEQHPRFHRSFGTPFVSLQIARVRFPRVLRLYSPVKRYTLFQLSHIGERKGAAEIHCVFPRSRAYERFVTFQHGART